ncbi:MAG TPA: response regulator [Parasegetibacter sp.]
MVTKKVLIIDDEPDFCLLLRTYLKAKQYDVFTANTIKEGVSLAQELGPDIIFLDNNLPDGLGWEQVPNLYSWFPQSEYFLMSAFHPPTPALDPHIKVRILEKPISFKSLDPYF